MASRNHSIRNSESGFSLLEILVVMSIFIVVAGLGLFVSFDNYRGYEFRAERDSVIALLQKARAQSINNMCFGAGCTSGKSHGIHIGSHQYVVFQGTSYATRDTAVDEVVQARYNTLAASGFTDVVFSQLAGTSTPTPSGVTTLTLTDTSGIGNSLITVSPEGRITWTQ